MKSLQIIRERDRFMMTGLSRIQWWRLEKLGRAPRRFQISTNSVGWLRSEIEQWVEARVASRETAPRAAPTIDSTDRKATR